MTTAVDSNSTCRVALDVMGGDHAPDEILQGALLAIEEYPVHILLVGREKDIRPKLDALGAANSSRLEIVDAAEVVEMDDTKLAMLRKRNSSIRVCANLVAEGRADSMVSAGHTGATWTSAYKVLGTIEGVDRPALTALLPNSSGRETILLDVGAQVSTTSAHLREFAVMGHFYAQMVLGIEAPRVGLLSIGEEEGKGNDLTKETFRVLKETGLNFIGNAEGRDIYNGNADVVVCDGFTGNVVLKASEALAEMVFKMIKVEAVKTPSRKIGAMLLKPAIAALKKRTDYSEYGGAPLLGVKGGTIVCHGRSNAKAIKNAIRVGRDFAMNRINEKIQAKVGDLHRREHDTLLEEA
jgi:glycerol-3-phosphate acyltransferase PlsX